MLQRKASSSLLIMVDLACERKCGWHETCVFAWLAGVQGISKKCYAGISGRACMRVFAMK
jgi:hypothetical protein